MIASLMHTEFEAWVRSESPSLDLTRVGHGYRHPITGNLFDAWRAAWNHCVPSAAPIELPTPAATVLSWSANIYTRNHTRSYRLEWHKHDLGSGTKLFTEQQLRTVVTQALRPTKNQGGSQ